MKKICIVTPNTLPVPAIKGGAVETLVNNLIDKNEELNKLDCTVITIKDDKAKQESIRYNNTRFKYIKVPFNSWIEKIKPKISKPTVFNKILRKILCINEILYSRKVYNFTKKEDFDFLIIEGGNPHIYTKTLKMMGKEKCIYHLHGNSEADKFSKIYFKYFIAISNFVKKKFIQNGLIDSERVTVINNGIDLNKFMKTLNKEEKELERGKFNIEKDSIVIEFCGRTIKEKGIKELIQAFKKMKNIDKCKLLIIGNSQFGNNIKTEYDKELEEEIKGIEDKIGFTGYIHNNELYKIYSISDISVIPSMWEEPSGLVVIEAMASSLPIVTTNSGGIPELVSEECAVILERDNRLVENLAQTLDKLVQNKELRKKMGQEGLKKSYDYGINEYYNNFVDFIEKI